MEQKRFDPSKLDRLNAPERIKNFPVLEIMDQLQLNNPQLVVDLGAGTAFYSIPIAEKFKDCKVIATDISDIMIEWMKEHVIPNFPNIQTLKMEDQILDIQDQSVDLLFMVNLHHELNSPELTLKESFRVLKYGGYIAISDWRKEPSEKGPSFELRYETETVLKQIQTTGFEIISCKTNYPDNFVIIGKKSNILHLLTEN